MHSMYHIKLNQTLVHINRTSINKAQIIAPGVIYSYYSQFVLCYIPSN